MKILYDGDIYNWQRVGGINRYFEGIISHLPLDCEPLLLTRKVWPSNWPSHPNLKIYRGPSFEPDRLSRRLTRHYFQALSSALRPDIVHPTYYYSLAMRKPDAYGCPSVVTVYDFILDLFSDQLNPKRDTVAVQREMILAASAIVCISNHTRNDLLNRFPQLESRTTVTHLAGDLDIALSYGPEAVPERPYFLFVGSRALYKNFDGLLRALAKIALKHSDFALAVCGLPFNELENTLIAELQLGTHIQHLGRVADPHLAKLYRCSLAFVYPSFYEGFGIPPLEAMNCETVVIAANTSSIPEVTGDAALLFDPHQPDELADLLSSVLQGQINREDLILRGRNQARLFNWQRTSQQTAEVYRNLMAQK